MAQKPSAHSRGRLAWPKTNAPYGLRSKEDFKKLCQSAVNVVAHSYSGQSVQSLRSFSWQVNNKYSLIVSYSHDFIFGEWRLTRWV